MSRHKSFSGKSTRPKPKESTKTTFEGYPIDDDTTPFETGSKTLPPRPDRTKVDFSKRPKTPTSSNETSVHIVGPGQIQEILQTLIKMFETKQYLLRFKLFTRQTGTIYKEIDGQPREVALYTFFAVRRNPEGHDEVFYSSDNICIAVGDTTTYDTLVFVHQMFAFLAAREKTIIEGRLYELPATHAKDQTTGVDIDTKLRKTQPYLPTLGHKTKDRE